MAELRGLMSKHDFEKLIHAFISCRVDYCSGLFTCFSKIIIKKLQLVQNAAVRALKKTKRADYLTPVLKFLHRLPLSHRIDFKALLLFHYDSTVDSTLS